MTISTDLFAGRYQLGPLLGQGGMSDVYRAVDQENGDSVAVKVVRSGDPELARRLAQEVKVHQRMEHPGLIRLLDTGLASGQAYLVMELIEGSTLAASLRGGPLGARLTAKLGGILAGALGYVHAQGIVHRDVKPSNIMLCVEGRALLGDFGIARVLDASTFTIDGTTLGTAAYMAPEQLEDNHVGPSADIWSLGIVLLECLTGRRVYEGTSSEILARRLAGPVPLPGDLPVPWKLLFSGMLDHRPAQRLNGGQVASLLASPVFAAPWTPAPISDTEPAAVTVPLDLTALAPGRLGAAAHVPDPTAVAPLPVLSPTSPTNPTNPGGPTDTNGGARHVRTTAPPRRRWLIAAVVAVIAAVALGSALAFGLGSKPPTHPALTSSDRSTTTTTTTTTTTAPPPTGPSALAALVRDVATGVDGGTLDPATGHAITNDAQQAQSDAASGRPNQAANDLQQVASIIADGEQRGTIPADQGATLQSDLSTLAGALGLSAAATPPSTTTTTPDTSPLGALLNPGHGKHGNGNGNGGG